ncbi:MAG: glycerophosphodiester phosphodiesterase [Clostridia bacterium]|nr:glycerophosphodiester phosphodiesterase [Clostridia bacterium]
MKEKILAHRGVSLTAPENTLPAFAAAIKQGLAGIELDVQMSKDGHLIVIHDERVDRTTNGKGLVRDMTLEEIKSLDAGTWFAEKYSGVKIPVLEEVLELIDNREFMINIELKSGIIQYPGLEERVLEAVKKYNLLDKVIFSSFNHYSLLKIKEIHEGAKTGVLYYAGLVDPWEYGKKLKAYSLHPFLPSVTEQMVKECLVQGLQVIPFTVNNKETAKKLIDFGVEYVIMDWGQIT